MSKSIYIYIFMLLLMVLTVSCVSAAEDIDDSIAAVDEQVKVQTASNDDSIAAVDEQVKVQTASNDVPLESDDSDADVLSAGTEDSNFNMKPNCNDYGDVSFSASTKKDATGTVHVKFILKSPGGDTVQADETLDLVNGSVKWGGPGNYLPKGSYTVWAEYSGDDKYASATLQTPDVGPDAFNVPKYPISLNFTSLAVNEKGNIVVNGQLDNANADGPYVLTFTNKDNGKTQIWYRQQVQSGGIIVNEKTPELGAGEYIVSISYVGTDQYFPASPQQKNINISAINITNEKIDLGIGDKIESGASLNPADAGNLTFVSSNESVVIVDSTTGLITAMGLGTATVNVSCAGNDKYGPAITKSITVTVSKAASVSVNNSTLDLFVDDTFTIVATTNPSGLNVTYEPDDSGVISVDENGVVTALKNGTGTITVKVTGNKDYAENSTVITVTVRKVPTEIKVNSPTGEMTVGAMEQAAVELIPSEAGNLTYVSNDTNVATVSSTGVITANNAGTALITVSYAGNDKYASAKSNIKITVKISSKIDASDVTAVYNVNEDLVITLKDASGNPISGVNIIVDLNGAKTYTTDANGQVKVSTKDLAPNTYTAKVTFNGNSIYVKSTKDVKVTVKKATPNIAAKAKTFKTTTKTKKYTITLKNNVNKAISKVTVYLKVGGKTYKATTNSKGKATFKITKLSKKGTYKATITYKGNAYYNKVTKKATIKVKSIWKTVSKGSKAKTTVKKIQKALKKKGYYHEYKIDGIYQKYTETAVKKFQKAKKLKVTGKVNEKTAKKLGII